MKVLCALCLLCGLKPTAVALDREAFTFTRYDLDVRVEPEQQRLGVRGKVTLRNDSDASQKRLVLQISSTLNWRSIQIAGKPAEVISQTYTSEGQRVVFCGRESQSDGNSNAGTRECAFRDLNSEVPFFVTEEFHTLDHPGADVFYLSDHKSQADDYALAMDEVAPFIENWFGDHRQTTGLKAEVIELPDTTAAPFESGTALLTPLSGNESADLLSAVQQLTHIAFPSPRAWIHDGLARYAHVNFLQEKEDRDAAIEYLRNHRQSLIESEKLASAETDQAARSLINADDEFYIQSKAMNVWWMLRDTVGDTALSAALHNYKSEDDKAPAYIQKLIEAQAHRDLEWFFDDWVYRDRGLPEFHVVSVYPRELLNGGYMVTVTVENSGQAGAEVPVTLKMANGERSERIIVPAKSSASVRIACPSFPQQAVVNDGSVPESDVSNNVYKIEH